MSAKWDPLQNMPDLRGKIVVVTGGNSGIGKETTKVLALKGATVYIAGRSEQKVKAAIDSLLTENPGISKTQLVWLRLDLADLKSVLRAVDELKSREQRVDILINNAGMATTSLELIGGGWETHMAINHIGHFVFTNGVLPLLKAATKQKDADVRIITLSSNAMSVFAPSNFRFDLSTSKGPFQPSPSQPLSWRLLGKHIFSVDMVRYGISKGANAMFAQKLQQVLDSQHLPILSISVHPGAVQTQGADDVLGRVPYFVRRATQISVEDGAITSLFAATAKEIRKNPKVYAGKYLVPYGKLEVPHGILKDDEQVSGLWENTEIEVNKHLKQNGLPPLLAW